MTVDEKGLIAGQRAAMVSNGCGCTWGGEHVFCDDPRLPSVEAECACKRDAEAAITAYLSARGAEQVAEFMGVKVLVNPQLPPDAAYIESRRADGSVDRARVNFAHPTPGASDD